MYTVIRHVSAVVFPESALVAPIKTSDTDLTFVQRFRLTVSKNRVHEEKKPQRNPRPRLAHVAE